MQAPPHPSQDPRNPPPPIEPTGFFTGVRIGPVLMGVVVDVVSTIVLSTLYFFLFIAKEVSEKTVSEEALSEYWSSSEGMIAGLVIGTVGTVIGGFCAGRRAEVMEIKHGALVGVGSIILGWLLQPGGEEQVLQEWQMMVAYAAAIPAGALGGGLAELLRGVQFTINPPGGGGRPSG